MKKKVESKKELKFKYIFSNEYNPIYVSGAFGGITPRKEIVLNFYFERHGLPYEQAFELNANGTLGKEMTRIPDDQKNSLIRYFENGIIINVQTAKDIRDWLNQQINIVDGMEKNQRANK